MMLTFDCGRKKTAERWSSRQEYKHLSIANCDTMKLGFGIEKPYVFLKLPILGLKYWHNLFEILI